MKILSILMAMLFSSLMLVAQQKDTFKMSGIIKGEPLKGFIFLSYRNTEGKNIKDSTRLENNFFSFSGTISEPLFAAIYLPKKTKEEVDWSHVAEMYIEKGTMKLMLDSKNFKEITLTGSKTNDEFREFKAKSDTILAEFANLRRAYGQANMANQAGMKNDVGKASLEKLQNDVEKINKQMEPYYERLRKANLAFFEKYPNSYITLNSLVSGFLQKLTVEELMRYYDRLSPQMKQSNIAKTYMKEIKIKQSSGIGAVAYNFSIKDIDGKMLSLMDYRKKNYVLLDFWASWCVPCRKGNPHLKELYNKYKEKGFEIIGVASDDRDPAAWRKAVAFDGIDIWKHVLEDRTGADIGRGYSIHILPTKILIDKEGKIMARYSYEDENELDAKLQEIFSK